MSLGAAVLTSSVTSLPEVVDDAGVMVDPFDVDAIYAGLRMLATQEPMLTRLRAQALQRAKNFSWRAAAAQALGIYRMLLEEYPRTIERNPVLGAVSD
jgi:glycosyltransferase involved in cell wall biosynthesis